MVIVNEKNELQREGREFFINYKGLEFFQVSHTLTCEIYKITKEFPKEELYSLTSQIRRASVSICSNIAEGSGKGSRAEFRRFLNISLGSAKEVEYQLFLAKDLEFISVTTYDRLNNITSKVIGMIVNYLKKI